MAGDKAQPLTPAEAKERLRLAASKASLRTWAESNPWSLLILALGGGYLAGKVPAARSALVWSLAQVATSFVKPAPRPGKTLVQSRHDR